MTIGERIRAARKGKRWTQKQLGEESGINEVQIRRYELNNSNPTKETVEKIATALEVSPWYLMGGEITASIQRQASALDGLIAILADMYGCAEMKWLEDGSELIGYCVIGKEENQIILEDVVLEKVLDMVESSVRSSIELLKEMGLKTEVPKNVMDKLNNISPTRFL